MNQIRKLVALTSALLVMGCQTVASAGSSLSPAPVTSVPGAQAGSAQHVMTTAPETEAAARAPVAAESPKRRTIILVAVLVAVGVAALLLLSGGDGGGY